MYDLQYPYHREGDELSINSLQAVFDAFTNIFLLKPLNVQDYTFGQLHVGSLLLGDFYNWESSVLSQIWLNSLQSAGYTTEGDLLTGILIYNDFASTTDDTVLTTGDTGDGWVTISTVDPIDLTVEGDALDTNLIDDNTATVLVCADVYILDVSVVAVEVVMGLQYKDSANDWHTIPRSIRRSYLGEVDANIYVTGHIELRILLISSDFAELPDRIVKGIRIIIAKGDSGESEEDGYIVVSDAYLTALLLVI